jgi:hypothetical protein
MKDYVPAIAAVIAGILALGSAIIAWRLKVSSDETLRRLALEKERRDETKDLYATAFELFERAIRQILDQDQFDLAGEFSKTNSRIHLLAAEPIVSQYSRVCSLLTEWSFLQHKASPKRIRAGDSTFTLIQSPDPAAKYREPAQEAYDELQRELTKLVQAMREELAGREESLHQAAITKAR